MKIAKDVYKINADSNVYLLKQKILIDTGDRSRREELKLMLSKIIDPEKIEFVIFTHLHYDHVGNFDLFTNAKFLASAQEIQDFKKDPIGTVLNDQMAEMLKGIKLHSVDDFDGLHIINASGHTRGSICILYENILFSGDTIFNQGYGRTDLPTSAPEQMQATIAKIKNYQILCPGHDY